MIKSTLYAVNRPKHQTIKQKLTHSNPKVPFVGAHLPTRKERKKRLKEHGHLIMGPEEIQQIRENQRFKNDKFRQPPVK